MTDHTKEPWRYNEVLGGCFVRAGTREILKYSFSPDDENKANARRIVACVNACEGIPTYQLTVENEAPLNLGEMIDTLRKERDELLAIQAPWQDSRGMFVARLERMQINRDVWITVAATLAILNECDRLAISDSTKAKGGA